MMSVLRFPFYSYNMLLINVSLIETPPTKVQMKSFMTSYEVSYAFLTSYSQYSLETSYIINFEIMPRQPAAIPLINLTYLH